MTAKKTKSASSPTTGRGKQSFDVPIRLEIGVRKKKMHYLNLGAYRNWQFQVANQMKKMFKINIIGKVRELTPVEKPIRATFTIYYPTRRLFDVDNIGSVVCKFTMDVLTEVGIIPDDNYQHVPEILLEFGGVDKENPRCEVTIEEMDDD